MLRKSVRFASMSADLRGSPPAPEPRTSAFTLPSVNKRDALDRGDAKSLAEVTEESPDTRRFAILPPTTALRASTPCFSMRRHAWFTTLRTTPSLPARSSSSRGMPPLWSSATMRSANVLPMTRQANDDSASATPSGHGHRCPPEIPVCLQMACNLREGKEVHMTSAGRLKFPGTGNRHRTLDPRPRSCGTRVRSTQQACRNYPLALSHRLNAFAQYFEKHIGVSVICVQVVPHHPANSQMRSGVAPTSQTSDVALFSAPSLPRCEGGNRDTSISQALAIASRTARQFSIEQATLSRDDSASHKGSVNSFFASSLVTSGALSTLENVLWL